MISYEESTDTFIVVFGSGTVGIANMDNCLLLKQIEQGPIGEKTEHKFEDANLRLEFNSVESIECLEKRLQKIKGFLQNAKG